MAVMTITNKEKEKEQNMKAKKYQKYLEKARPITATLEHPLILDIKLLKKLDMTTFTKKGLIALSKFCGISLIKKTDSKRKLNKYIKTIQGSRKHLVKEIHKTMLEDNSTNFLKKDKVETKRKYLKPKIEKQKPKINYKSSDESTVPDEDSLDVICKKHEKHDKPKKTKQTIKQKQKQPLKENDTKNKEVIIEEMFKSSMKNTIPEPCKTCIRSEHPERFHSHPKSLVKQSENNEQITQQMALEERLKNLPVTKVEVKESSEKKRRQKNLSAKNCGDYFSEKYSSDSCKDDSSKNDPLLQKSAKTKLKSDFSPKISSAIKTSESSPGIKENSLKIKSQSKSSPIQSPIKSVSKNDVSKSGIASSGENSQEKLQSDELPSDTLKYITGCYICGRPVSPKIRMKHEEECILEWRNKNSLLSPDSRKPEPRRPDFRFTEDGSVDFKGTFDSIWANHKDSLSPCKKCGRKFFPERIEKHQKCCNNRPIKFNFKN